MTDEHQHRVEIEGRRIRSPRLELRPWSTRDAPAALATYGSEDVTRWLSPAMGRAEDVATMEAVIEGWQREELPAPAGRWALALAGTGELVGGIVLLPLPPEGHDLQIGWQLAPAYWGQGRAGEAGHAVAHFAFASGVEELFAVVRPRNERGARTARSIGMEWVGESEKYFDLRLQVYRLRKGELDVPRLPRVSRLA
ncbi:MAG: family N-acetyltransferase [Marmoricola sp.]|nr:family N-acetyltransferase [Marmoricola sp.]